MNKKELRKAILARRDDLSLKERDEKSAQIVTSVLELEELKNANKILLYASMRSEVQTDDICYKAKLLGKEIYYPRVQGNEMKFYSVDEGEAFEVSTFGVREPKMELAKEFLPKEEDMIFVLMPGVVFDQEGNRIGYGGGYYDKYLHWLEQMVESENICKVAVAYECQMVDEGKIDREVHDVRPDYIVTEHNTYVI